MVEITELKMLECKIIILIAWKYREKSRKQIPQRVRIKEGYSRVKWLYDIPR